MASASAKFKMPIRPLELRRSKSQCSSGHDINEVALHERNAVMDQMFGFIGGVKRSLTDEEQTARLSWERWKSIPRSLRLRKQQTRFVSTSTKTVLDRCFTHLRANSLSPTIGRRSWRRTITNARTQRRPDTRAI